MELKENENIMFYIKKEIILTKTVILPTIEFPQIWMAHHSHFFGNIIGSCVLRRANGTYAFFFIWNNEECFYVMIPKVFMPLSTTTRLYFILTIQTIQSLSSNVNMPTTCNIKLIKLINKNNTQLTT